MPSMRLYLADSPVDVHYHGDTTSGIVVEKITNADHDSQVWVTTMSGSGFKDLAAEFAQIIHELELGIHVVGEQPVVEVVPGRPVKRVRKKPLRVIEDAGQFVEHLSLKGLRDVEVAAEPVDEASNAADNARACD